MLMGFSLPVVVLVFCFCKSRYVVCRIVIKMGLSFFFFFFFFFAGQENRDCSVLL